MTIELVEEIRKMNKLLVFMTTKDLAQSEKIELLSKVGFGPRDIADLVGTTANTVNVALNRLKKSKKK